MYILEQYPDATRVADKSGRLPLHIAIETGLSWLNGTKDILEQNYDALEAKDPVTGMYPFMTSSIENKCALDGRWSIRDASSTTLRNRESISRELFCIY